MTRKLLSPSNCQHTRAGINALFLLVLMLTGMPSSAQQANMHGSQGAVLEVLRQEVVRQELVKERLDDIASGFEYLIRDMQSNQLLDDHNRDEMARLVQYNTAVNAHHVTKATEALRRAAAADDPAPHLSDAERHIDQAARDIGSMMIRLGIRYANEVVGRELQELTVIQSDLYVQALRVRRQADDNMELPWRPQSRVAYHTVQLLAEVSEVEDHGTDALAMVRLARIINRLHEAKIEFTLQEAAKDLRDKATDSAIEKQRQALDALMKAQFRALPGSEMRVLIETRDNLIAIRKEQEGLRDAVARWDQDTLRRRQSQAQDDQTALRDRVDEIVAPPILEEAAHLPKAVLQATGLETAVSELVPIDPFLDEAKARMADATDRIGEMKAEAAGKTQVLAEAALDRAIEMIAMRIDAARHLNSVYRRLQDAFRRLKRIDDLIDQQTELKEQTEQAEVEAGPSRQLALSQNSIGAGVESFRLQIARDIQESKAPSDYVPLIAVRLDGARQHMIGAVVPLKNNNPADALPVQEQALAALHGARTIAEREVDLLGRLWQLLQAVEVVQTFQQYLNDLEIEQRGLREKAAQADVDALAPLAPSQQRFAAAAEQARRMLDPGKVDMSRLGGILDSVMAAMSAAEQRIADGQADAAVNQQLEAEKHIREARQEVTRLDEELALLAEWIGFVDQLNADAMRLLQHQTMLRLETEQAEFKAFEEFAAEQDALRTGAESASKLLPIGAADYAKAAGFMQKAVAALEGEDRIEAMKRMALAEDALAQALEQITMAMAALNQAPMLSLIDKPPGELRIITRLMLLVSHQSSLRRKTIAATADTGVIQLEQPQRELLDEIRDIVRVAATEMPELTEMPQVTKADNEMEAARNALSTADRSESVGHQELAEKLLREVVLGLLLEGFKLPEELEEKISIWMAGPTPLIILEEETTFAKKAVEGELRGGGRTEWRVLGERDRSALNQNFARELPLEYRDMLRVYFERISE
jgi:hypothetical protein